MTEQQPLVSIVIPCYNHAQFVQETIQSVIDQDYENIELIIIDDGSKDNSVEVIQEMIPACEERFVRFEFRYRPNKGLCATLNEALEWCEGEYFSALASDDIILSFKIIHQMKILNNNQNIVGIFGGTKIMLRNGKILKNNFQSKKYCFKEIFLHQHYLPAPTQLLRLQAVRNIGGFREGFIIEDWVMWLDLTKDGRCLYFDNKIVACYRRHEGNLSSQLDKMLIGRLQIVEAFKDQSLYRKAKAKVFFVQALDQQFFNKVKSIPLMIKAVALNPLLIFKKSFVGYLAKFVIKRRSVFI